MRRERGSVSVVLAAAILVVLVLVVGLADLARALVARSAARTAADAAALAAVQEMAFPTGRDPGELAAEYAAANGAVMTACTCAPGTTEAVVEVSLEAGDLVLVPGTISVTARARALVDLPSA